MSEEFGKNNRKEFQIDASRIFGFHSFVGTLAAAAAILSPFFFPKSSEYRIKAEKKHAAVGDDDGRNFDFDGIIFFFVKKKQKCLFG